MTISEAGNAVAGFMELTGRFLSGGSGSSSWCVRDLLLIPLKHRTKKSVPHTS